jgi:serine/threonine protein kinase
MSEVIGKPKTYKILECLHENKNSKVFKVLCQESDLDISRVQVLKIIHSKNSIQECVNEFKNLRSVQSEYCVPIYSWEFLNNQPALVMDFVEGISLKELVSHFMPSSQQRDTIVSQIYLGLRDLEKNNISHGDLSPNNVLIDIDGNVRLIDYGIANISGKYTPSFVAPEILSDKLYGFSADLYSLGRLMVFMGASISNCKNLLSLNPKDRKWDNKLNKGWSRQKKELGFQVRKILDKKSNAATQVLDSKELEVKKLPIKLNYFILVLFFLSLMFSSAESKFLNPFPRAFLTVKSKTWVKVSINNEFVGYAPFFNKEIYGGRVHIHLSHKNKDIQHTLTLLPGEHKTIEEF